jgi:hypothetical protein
VLQYRSWAFAWFELVVLDDTNSTSKALPTFIFGEGIDKEFQLQLSSSFYPENHDRVLGVADFETCINKKSPSKKGVFLHN